MSHPVVRISPIATQFSRRNPKILLCGSHQPTLLRFLDGRPRRNGGPHAFLIQFVDPQQSLASFKDDQFDLAVVQAPSAERVEEVVRDLTRVARQGLITRC
ncbi:class I SAM-dependent methyltransferase [Pseudomonas phytophila]|uniref:Class I SAM-dependent methyltransferase n=1 Tax=Pseudomonas phytophila TaxID=2867264 RepID=A0ABY6FLE1_9PSED|nr:class I SAM-dependent methyltransferase [Pseudomonas phytophila]UXZ98566.1 class I SAM-dependent methyltransferase [Pseudomonas phytophila]